VPRFSISASVKWAKAETSVIAMFLPQLCRFVEISVHIYRLCLVDDRAPVLQRLTRLTNLWFRLGGTLK
jgi:hypothetical protein